MTTDSLTQIAQWIVDQPMLIRPDQTPATDNPFTQIEVDNIGGYQGSSRLGFVYQELCKRLFTLHPDYQIITEEHQIRDGKNTLGAIDFLLKHNSNVEHWEVALKFYLLKGGLWYGPDSRDRLDIKLARMLNHQLKITNSEAFQRDFPEIQKIIPKMFIQGRLYTNPFSKETPPTHCLNHKLNNDVFKGYWCYQHEIKGISEPLYKLQKINWIAGNLKQRELLTSLPEYSVHCQSESGQFWIVVPDSWPN